MPRVHHVLHARKAQKEAGIKKGDAYYWWKFRFGGKHVSLTRPKPSQLTQSEYLSTLLSLEETGWAGDTKEDAAQSFRDAAQEIRDLGQEQSDKRDNMPDSLQDSDTGQLLSDRADRCEAIADELESAADEVEQWEPEEVEAVQEEGANPDDLPGEQAEADEDEAEGWRELADEKWGEVDWSPE